MPIIRTVEEWIPGSLKVSPPTAPPGTSIVFPENIIHPGLNSPNVNVPIQEEEMMVFLHFLMRTTYETYLETPPIDVIEGFEMRRGYLSDSAPNSLRIQYTVTIPLESTLLFGKRVTQ